MQPGDTVGPYEILAQRGTGGMATVYHAYHARLDRDVAIKVMHPNFLQDDDFLARFEREAQIVAKLEHPNIVPVYDFADHDGQPYLVMKYIAGRTLKQVMFKRALTLGEILRIGRAIAEALSYAHTQGVLHRDVKPANVILDENETPYLTDFGLARLVSGGDSSMSQNAIIGTPNYVSPEQAEGNTPLTASTDVYSLGVMLYEMVVGRVPFQGDTPYAVIHDHIYTPVPAPSTVNPEVPQAVEAVLLKTLAKAPGDRYPSATALMDAFEAAVEGSGLRELSEDRSGVFTVDAGESVEEKPKRTPLADEAPAIPAPSPELSGILLLENETSLIGLSDDEIIRRRLRSRREELFGVIMHGAAYAVVNIGMLAGWFFSSEGGYPGFLITTFGWGAGLAAHAVSVMTEPARRIDRLYRYYDDVMTRDHGPDWRIIATRAARQEGWLSVQEWWKERRGAYIHSAVYVLIISMLWNIWLGNGFEEGFDSLWPLFPTLGWGLGLIGHWAGVLLGSRVVSAREDSVQAELDRARSFTSVVEKPKHTAERIRLTEDGELTDSMAAEAQTEQRNARFR